MSTHPDGHLPAAITAAQHATANLITKQRMHHLGVPHTAPSRYHQLQQSLQGEQGSAYGHVHRSMPLIWLDALELRTEIDDRIRIEQPHGRDTPDRINRILNRPWRPQDTHWLHTYSNALQTWADQIDSLLNPAPHWTLPAACPNCDTTTVHRRDTAGELVRQPALHITPTGCTCSHCRAHWNRDQFPWLANLLNTPTNTA